MSAVGRQKIFLPLETKLQAFDAAVGDFRWELITGSSSAKDYYLLLAENAFSLTSQGGFATTSTFIPDCFQIRAYPHRKASEIPPSLDEVSAADFSYIMLLPLGLSSPGVGPLRGPARKAEKAQASLWGTTRSLLATNIRASAQGLSLKISLRGVGFKAFLQPDGKELLVRLGHSHEHLFPIPKGISLEVSADHTAAAGGGENQLLSLRSASLSLLNDFADSLRRARPPEPYKGKGVLIRTPKNEEKLRRNRKEGKQKNA